MRLPLPLLALCAALLALPAAVPPAAAEPPAMDAAGFEAQVTGRTLNWARGGAIFGTEHYLPGRRVRWAFAGGACRSGHWYGAGEHICFVYEDSAGQNAQCWRFWLQDGQLHARFAADPPGPDQTLTATPADPLRCAGPDLGV